MHVNCLDANMTSWFPPQISLQSNNILIKIWNRKEGSAWVKLFNQIKKGERKEENIYVNYMMTSKGNNIMLELRALKREGKLEKIFSDENWEISIKVHEKISLQQAIHQPFC